MTVPAAKRSGGRRGINDWFSQMPGRLVLDSEVEILNRILPNLFGYHLLQVGQLCDADMMVGSRILGRSIAEIDEGFESTTYPSFRAAAHALPIASDSVDVVLLPHVLEFETTPHEALREAQRVLVPEGHVLITGFNPWSLMGYGEVCCIEPVPYLGRVTFSASIGSRTGWPYWGLMSPT